MGKSQPNVSCIMPTVNRENFVSKVITLFQLQDYVQKELLIIDDGTSSVTLNTKRPSKYAILD